MDSSSPPPSPLAAFPPADPAPPPLGPILRITDGRDRAGTRPEPLPSKASVCHLRVGPHVVTSIYREWPPGLVGPRGDCRRCPSCTAQDEACHVQVPLYVPREEAPSFAIADLPRPVRQYL